MGTNAPRQRMTLEEFLDWEEHQPERWELVAGAPVAMMGETVAHNQIVATIDRGLAARLRGTGCRVFREGVKMLAGTQCFYPDIAVTCRKVGDRDRFVLDPVVIVEVASDSTWRYDLIVKNNAYRTLESLRQYVLVEQGQIGVQSFVRTGEGWVHSAIGELDGVLALPALGIEIPLCDLYLDTELAEGG